MPSKPTTHLFCTLVGVGVYVYLASALIAEASCLSQIRTAKAVVQDFGEEEAARKGVLKWARASEIHPERDSHQVIKKQKSVLDIPVKTIQCDGIPLPWISPESWLVYLVDNGLWPLLAGCERHDYAGADHNWSRFWEAYKKIDPSFDLFHMEGIDYSKTAAMLIHGDEGRTLKKNGIMITSLQSCLGRGYDEKRVRKEHDKLQVNFAGHSFTSRYILSTIPKTAYETHPEAFHKAIDHVARSCSKLLEHGYVDKARGNELYRVVILGVKGDAPYLQKVAHFYRSYNTTAKRGDERGPPKGCCPYCLAGTNACAAEEIGTDNPRWLRSVAVKLPWVRTPALIQHLVHDRSDPAAFFKSDIWHIYHLGFGRSWVCSVIQVLLPYLPLPNLDEKWAYLSDHYINWCRSKRRQSHVTRITPYLMSYGDATGTLGNWSKGALTTNFSAWLVDLLSSGPRDPDGLLMKCCAATRRVNSMFSALYRAGAFLGEEECAFVAEQGQQFLVCYADMALRMYRQDRQWLFPLYPKLHVFHHLVLQVQRSGLAVKSAINPTMWGCQMDEDEVGRASRLSRRVNIRKVSLRTLERYLVAAHTAFVRGGLLS